jgi:HAD superfamily hydrolase (TIGR01509 family)
MLQALIFDVDGTLAETEEYHRNSFNAAFKAAGLPWHWDKALYAKLLTTTGGKERIARFVSEQHCELFSTVAIATLHKEKNQIYADTLAQGKLALRPGVLPLINAAKRADLKIGIATTTSKSNLEALLRCYFASGGTGLFDAIVCGEDVKLKKPDPEVYNLCLAHLGADPGATMAFEDSDVGLKAALAAGIKTVVTPSTYTADDDFTGAALVLPDLAGFGL